MAQFLAPLINDQQEDANGNPLSGGTISVYLAGTSTPANTTSDKAGLIPNSWPIVLNTLGLNNQGAVWLTGGSAYKFVVKDASNVTLRTIDNVSGINDTTVTADQWVVFQAAPTFVSATSFTVAGDQTSIFQPGRRVKTTNTGGLVYGTITSSVYSAPNTTVSIATDSGSLDSGLSAVSYGLISVSDTSLPGAFLLGQCRLVKSGANIVLQPYQGNRITINGAAQRIPSAGVSLAATGLTPSTLYYIYAAIVSGAIALEASTTGHSTDTTTGVEIKTGDPTRTLVGMARPVTGPAWQDAAQQRFVISWFNRQELELFGAFSTGRNYGSSTPGEPNSEIRNEFLTWGGVPFKSFIDGAAQIDTISAYVNTYVALDGVAQDASCAFQAYAANARGPVSCTLARSVPEGYHYTTLFGATGGSGVITFLGGAAVGRCSLKTLVQG